MLSFPGIGLMFSSRFHRKSRNPILKKVLFKNAIYKALAFFAVFLSMGACLKTGVVPFAVSAVLTALFFSFTPESSFLSMFAGFLVALNVSEGYGVSALMITFALAGLFTLALSALRSAAGKNVTQSFDAGLSLAVACLMTVMITTYYFGIGASGHTAITMIKSYVSFGFHANWRGVLYGTIVMVVMITFPRKFKKLSKIIPAPFSALLITYVLNFFLIPAHGVQPVELITYSGVRPVWLTDLGLSGSREPYCLVSGISGALAHFVLNKVQAGEKKELAASGAGDIAIGGLTGYSPALKPVSSSAEFAEGAIAALIIAALCVSTRMINRMPLASLAVVLIVKAWQTVEWGKLKVSFTHLQSAAVILIMFIVTALANISAAIICGFVLSFLFSRKPTEKV